jgi:pyrimidine-nucleoside phosphorylase
VTGIDSLEIGLTGIHLGAGRTKVDDVIDPKAGIILSKKIGDSVNAGETLATLTTDNQLAIESSAKRIVAAFSIGPSKPKPLPLIISSVDENGISPFKI